MEHRGFLDRILHEPACLERFLLVLSVNTTSMFRDPAFYLSLRQQINQHLRRRELGTDAEAVAAYTAGSVQFDEQDGALVHLHGEVKQRVVTNGRILADPRMKIDYRATRINGELYVPSLWSDGKIETGGGLAKNKTAWFIYSTDTVELVGCEEEHVTSIIHTTPTN